MRCLATVISESVFRPRLADSLCQVIAAYTLRLNSRAGTEGLMVSSLICDHWLILRCSVLVAAWTTDNRWLPAVCAGQSSMAMFTLAAKLHPGAHGVRCARAMAVHHAVGISCQRNSGYRQSRVNIMTQSLSTLDPSLSPIHVHRSIRRGHATTTHYTHHIRLAWWCRATLH